MKMKRPSVGRCDGRDLNVRVWLAGCGSSAFGWRAELELRPALLDARASKSDGKKAGRKYDHWKDAIFGRLRSDVDNCSTEPRTVTATDLFLAGAVLDGGATGGYAFEPGC